MMSLGLSDYTARQLSRPSGYFGSRFIGRMMNRSNAGLEKLSLQCSVVTTTDHVLEIGFGNGKLLNQLCQQVKDGQVYGVDISEDLIQQVSQRLQVFIRKNKLQLHLAGVSELPFADNSLDTIITNNTIYFWPNPKSDVKELFRVLKSGGKLVIGYRTVDDMANYSFVTENMDIFKNHYSDEQVKQLVTENGFSSINIHVQEEELAVSHVAVCLK